MSLLNKNEKRRCSKKFGLSTWNLDVQKDISVIEYTTLKLKLYIAKKTLQSIIKIKKIYKYKKKKIVIKLLTKFY